MKEIQLDKGKIALVSDEDYERVIQFKWWASYVPKRGVYVALGKVHKKTVSMHRFITNAINPKLDVDHWNHDTLDNQRGNLRVCTRSQNNANQLPQVGRSSRFKGVSWQKNANRWMAYIKTSPKRYYLGLFDTEEAAAIRYNEEATKLFGEFAYLNLLTDEEMKLAVSHPPQRTGYSLYRGVTFDKGRGKWRAKIEAQGKRFNIGTYLSEKEAAIAYNNKAIELWGDKAPLNKISA